MLVSQIETPALIVDLDALERNHAKMMERVNALGIRLRPHYKSHKSTYLAHYQMANGAVGISCAKLSEAEDLIAAGIENVMIANQVTDAGKILRLAHLASCCRLSVCVDDEENIRKLSEAAKFCGSTIFCFVEYDVGLNRCGVKTEAEVLSLVCAVENAENLSFAGIQAYAGHIAHEENLQKRTQISASVEEKVKHLRAFLKENGIEGYEVGGVSTGTMAQRKEDTVYTELQCGSYLFVDAAYNRVGVEYENSLFLLCGVVSAGEKRLVTDGGVKTLGMDQGNPVFCDFPNAEVEMSEEHCAVYVEHDYKIGDKLRLIPGHCCSTINLHDFLYLVRGDKVVNKIPVTSRGKSR